ncbi:MAG: hypothetical protein ABIL39_10260 [candidate division WOR-3 bacterium]
MRDKYEEQRWGNRARGIWAIILILIAFISYIEVGDINPKWLFIIIGIVCAAIAILFIWWVTKKEK